MLYFVVIVLSSLFYPLCITMTPTQHEGPGLEPPWHKILYLVCNPTIRTRDMLGSAQLLHTHQPSLSHTINSIDSLSVNSHLVQNQLRIARCYAHYRLMQVTPTCWKELPLPNHANGSNTNSSIPKAAPKQRYS